MVHHMRVDPWAELLGRSLLPCSLNNLADREVGAARVFAMQKGGSNPNLIGNFQGMLRGYRHIQPIP
jgi:hypothetical protein